MKTHHLRILSFASIVAMLCVCCSFADDEGVVANNLIVYGPVLGLPPSEHYAVDGYTRCTDGQDPAYLFEVFPLLA